MSKSAHGVSVGGWFPGEWVLPRHVLMLTKLLFFNSALQQVTERLINRNTIHSCSGSVLQAFQTINCQRPLVQKFYRPLSELSLEHGSVVKFFWVPALVGVHGNRAADVSTKESCHSPVHLNPNPNQTALFIADLCINISTNLVSEW